jgi:hypothetical protein
MTRPARRQTGLRRNGFESEHVALLPPRSRPVSQRPGSRIPRCKQHHADGPFGLTSSSRMNLATPIMMATRRRHRLRQHRDPRNQCAPRSRFRRHGRSQITDHWPNARAAVRAGCSELNRTGLPLRTAARAHRHRVEIARAGMRGAVGVTHGAVRKTRIAGADRTDDDCSGASAAAADGPRRAPPPPSVA